MVESCRSHMSDAEWAMCLEARKRRNAALKERWDREMAEREARGDFLVPEVQPEPVPCSGQCVSHWRDSGRDSDSAISKCARCDGYVCMVCGTVRVGHLFGMCGPCEKKAYDDYDAEDAAQMDHGPDPAGALHDLVNRIAAVTGSAHRDVNARINRSVGVRTRVGADERVVRQAVWVAREWLRKEQPGG